MPRRQHMYARHWSECDLRTQHIAPAAPRGNMLEERLVCVRPV